MPPSERVTVTLSTRLSGLRVSLEAPHPETAPLSEEGLRDWADRLPDEDAASLVDLQAGKPLRWIAGEGWTEGFE